MLHSAQINTGDNSKVPAGIATDIAGNSRIGQTTVDKGAFENEGCSPAFTRLYVNADIGNGNGTSWASAISSLQTALSIANGCSGITEIWVAKGIYYPSTTSRAISFQLKNGLAIYGGFTGNETALSQRKNIWKNATILSGNGVTGKTYHVVTGTNLNGTAILDGFYVEDGLANNISDNRGAGMLFSNAAPTIRNCIIRNNNADFASSSESGAGVRISGGSEGMLIENCVFRNNKNQGEQTSGAIEAISCNVTLNNCVFIENTGIIRAVNAVIKINNSTAFKNTGSLFWIEGNNIEVANSIFKGGTVYFNNAVTAKVTNSIVPSAMQGYGTGNLDMDPLLVNEADPDGPDNTWGTLDDGGLPDVGSVAFNTGNNTLVPGGLAYDLAGTPRKFFNTVDRGAYEGMGTAVRCPGTTLTYKLPADGVQWTWFIDSTGTGFITLTNNGPFSGVSTATLTITNTPASLAGAKIAGLVIGGPSAGQGPVYTISFSSEWKGENSNNWSDGSNWSCGVPNNAKTAIIPLNTANIPVVTANSKAGGLILFDGLTLQIQEGIKLEIKK
jgi:hypothetical protein